MQETWVWSLGREDPLEKEMATHSSTLAWKIPWTEEDGGLQCTGSQRVGHDWATSLSLSAFFIVQLSHPYRTTGKTIALTRWTFVGKVMSLLFNMLSRLVIAFFPKEQASLNFMAVSYNCWLFVCLLWKNVYPINLCIFKLAFILIFLFFKLFPLLCRSFLFWCSPTCSHFLLPVLLMLK